MALHVNSLLELRFDTLRRVPLHCRRILPLSVMKQYQCVVVGATRGELSVAFSARPCMAVIRVLRIVTGCHIFPVLTEPARIRLLIKRIELYEQHRRALNWPYYICEKSNTNDQQAKAAPRGHSPYTSTLSHGCPSKM